MKQQRGAVYVTLASSEAVVNCVLQLSLVLFVGLDGGPLWAVMKAMKVSAISSSGPPGASDCVVGEVAFMSIYS